MIATMNAVRRVAPPCRAVGVPHPAPRRRLAPRAPTRPLPAAGAPPRGLPFAGLHDPMPAAPAAARVGEWNASGLGP